MTRELDIKVAIKLGWTRLLQRNWFLEGVPPGSKGDIPYLSVPKWSTDLKVAMELWQDGWLLEKRYRADVVWKIKGKREAPTPAEAIALAFLGEENG